MEMARSEDSIGRSMVGRLALEAPWRLRVRLGVMGGTFNPIHYGHLAAANEVCEAFALDTVVFVPAAVPPHKDLAAITDPRHRLVMTMLATISHPHFAVSSVEIDRLGASYTVDTVAQLKDLYQEQKAIYFIVGIDAFADIAAWRQPDVLLGSCHTIVTSRPRYDVHELVPSTLRQVSEMHPRASFEPLADRQQLGGAGFQVRGTPYQIYLQEVSGLDISSTDIRQRVITGRSIRYLLPDSVDAYIRKYQLYR
jgi:nicotinate-nucleotide adenylyltransferase